MSNMIDMKLSNEESEAPGSMLGGPTEANGPKYPYGLRIDLDSTVLKKLAIGESGLPKVGDIVVFDAVAEVVSVSKDDGQIEDGLCVCLQIQQMCVESAEDQMNEQQKSMSRINDLYK